MKFISQPIFKKLNVLLATSLTLVAQSGWVFVAPALADKEAADGTTICAVPGRDGVLSGGGQVNTIYSGTSASAAAGTSNLDLGPSTGASTPIEPGDLLLVIQMQGADINSTNTAAYGDGNATNPGADNTYSGAVAGYLDNSNFTAGNFEYVIANSSVGTNGGTLNLITALKKSYSNADATATSGQRRFQVIRVPQYASANITTAITAPAWDGSKGGIVAIDVAGELTFGAGGSINADGKGFRGGGGRELDGTTGLSNTDVVTFSTSPANASKGEGIVGTPKYLVNSNFTALITNGSEGYPNGSYGRGAPGNAGGGGTDGNPSGLNDQNSGGGGGGNGGFGGKGGNTWKTNLPYGGDGGVLFPASAGGRLVLGGGGGAGTINDNTGSPVGIASSGAPGGGIVMVRAGSISGSGVISANGKTPSPTTIPSKDGSGGGGAGGSILVITDSGNVASSLTLNANGGTGGSNTGASLVGNQGFHGPGGGGGGGAILASPGATISVAAGLAGTTKDKNGTSSYGGATAGEGFSKPTTASPSDAATMISGANCLLKTTKSTSTPGPLLAPNIATYTITVSNPPGANRPEARGVEIADAGLPPGFTHTATPIVPVYSTGATGPASVTATGTSTQPIWNGPFTIPPGGSVSITFNADIASTAAPNTYNNSATATAKYINTSAGSATVSPNAVTSNYNGLTNTADDVTITGSSPMTVDKTVALAIDKDGSGGTTPLANQTPTPGDVLEYTIISTNPSTVNTSLGVILKDAIPANTTYLPGSMQIAGVTKTDAGDTDTAEFVSNQIVMRLGTVAPTTSVTIKFRVTINDPATLGTATVSNQAIVTSTGNPDQPSNDPTTTPPNDPTIAKVGPRLRLVKRITGIKKDGTSAMTPIGGYINDATAVNDDPIVGWVGGAATYLQGITKTAELPVGLTLAPKDQVEYTIYFLADSATAAQSANLCDFVPANQTFVDNSLKLQVGTGANTTIPNGNEAGNGFYPPSTITPPKTTTFPLACTGTDNKTGAAYVQLGNIPSVYGTPASAYGKFSFLATVK